MHILIPALHRPTKPTGVCRHAVNLATSLATQPCVTRITLLIGLWQQEYFDRSFDIASTKIQIVSIDIENSSFSRNRWFMFGLPKVAKQLRPDIVHMSFPFPFYRPWFDVPIVSTIHDLYAFELPQNFGYPQVWFNQLFLRQCIRNSDGLVCVSDVTQKALKRYFFRTLKNKRTTTIYNVVDLKDTKPEVPKQFEHSSPNPFLLTVAQHRKNKNLDLLINACCAIQHQLSTDTRLILIGSEGPETSTLKSTVESLALQNKVMFLSGLTDGELRWMYENAKLFIIPSSTEGFCLPLAEAISFECPAICSDIPIFREVGGAHCHYFMLDDQAEENLVDAILFALSHPKDNIENATEKFSRQEISEQLVAFYKSLLESSAFLLKSNEQKFIHSESG